ncbi:carbohydrate ABC transporter permease [Gordonia aichiensis]|uniref:carbohydrate ABC transporter permease n=1 Tax=Gordonia aichiensis TaxID=36820 RepID=UPI0032642695
MTDDQRGEPPHDEPAPGTQGRHAHPGDADGDPVTSTGPNPSADGIPAVHSDVWVAPPGAPTGPPPAGPPVSQQPVSQPPVTQPAVTQPPMSQQPATQQPVSRPPVPAPVGAAATSAAVSAGATGPGMNGGSMSEILDTGPAPVPAKPPVRKATARRSSERRLAYWLVAPAALVMALVTGYPIVYAFWLSLNKATLTAPDEQEFVGLSNYTTVLGDGYWWSALGVTVFITVVSVLIELVLGMAIALVMHRTLFGRGTVRTVVLIPYGIVTVAAAFSWYYAWTPGTGYLANLLPDGSAPLTQQWPSLFIIILAEVWKTTPFMALLLLAGLALVPDELLKAAQLDGAGPWTRLFRIIVPLMKPAILVALLFRTLDAFRIFDNIYVLTAGSNGTGSVSMLGYDNLFKAFNLGVGSAISILIFLCVAIIAFVFIKGFGTAAPGSDDEGR